MRSRPASASVIWVPMPTTWNIGATRNARNAVNDIRSPRVSVPAKIWRAPTYITVAPTTPISTVAERLISEMAVSEREHVVEQALRRRRRRLRPPAPRHGSP